MTKTLYTIKKMKRIEKRMKRIGRIEKRLENFGNQLLNMKMVGFFSQLFFDNVKQNHS